MPVLVPDLPSVAPGTLDWVTLAEAKQALNVTAVTWDAEIAAYVTAVSLTLDKEVGPVVARTVVEARHGGAPSIWLYEYPVLSVTSVVEHSNLTAGTLTAETNLAKTATNYAIDLASGQLRRRSSNADSVFAAGSGNVVVTYAAGRYADTASVDARFKQAALIMLTTNWKVEQGAGTQTFGGGEAPLFEDGSAIPAKVLQFLQADLRGPAVA